MEGSTKLFRKTERACLAGWNRSRSSVNLSAIHATASKSKSAQKQKTVHSIWLRMHRI